jgi:hypothetical protein
VVPYIGDSDRFVATRLDGFGTMLQVLAGYLTDMTVGIAIDVIASERPQVSRRAGHRRG